MTLPVVFTANGQAGYNLTKSLRFRSSASAYLNRTPASAATSRRIMTYSAWVKIGTLGTQRLLYEGYTSVSDLEYFYFNSSDQLEWGAQVNGGTSYGVRTPAVFRDPSAWYHVVIAIDTTQATDTNRIKIYVNGVQQTGLTTFYSGFPAQNTDLEWNNQSSTQVIAWGGHTGYYDGYMAEINMVDGQALTPSSFGETSTTTGVWQPKKYTGTYGTNGFYLPFTDTTSTSTLGTDFSGNSNTWTVNNISLTSGTTYDSMTDVPTLTSATTANYATLNPLAMYGTNAVISNANLTSSATSTSNDRGWASTIAAPSSGKWYAEFTFTATSGDNNGGCGVMLENGTGVPGESATTVSWRDFGTLRQNATGTSYGSALTTNDIVIVAYDAALGRVWFGKNGTWFASGDPATNANPSATGITSSGRFATYHFNTVAVIQANFGQRPFSYTPPTGFVALNTFNLPTPTIGATASTTANEYFDATLYTGNSTTNNIVNAGGMQPDFVWIKSRSNNQGNNLFDSVRGAGYVLFSNATNAETNNTANFTSFNSNGFSLASNGGDTNLSGYTYVGWQWRASNATAVTNTAGSITSTVSANTTAGFSIVTYTGTGSNATVGHGLGVAPSMIIIKNRSTVTDWPVYHGSNTTSPATQRVLLNTTDATATSSTYWNNTAPTSSVFSISTYSGVNGNTNAMVAYCFAPIAGYSAFGSYTGNGSSDGTFVYTGFRPRWVMVKRTNAAEGWEMFDSARDTYNPEINLLEANLSNAENSSSTNAVDFLSNGFKMRNTRSATNGTSDTYIYACFAENPFKYANAR